jgi:hypothetical protein
MAKKTYEQVFAEIREIVGNTYDLDSAMEAIVGDCSCDQEMRELRAENERLKNRVMDYESVCRRVVEAWDDDEIGQLDGELIDDIRVAIHSENNSTPPLDPPKT